MSLPPQPVYLDADPARLQQVLANLLNNAAKYTEPGGRIWLEARPEDGEVVVRVRDTGVGIAPELLPVVFDLFVQADRTLERAQGGLGIGLTLVRNLVELHGGSVSVSSAGPGRGSEFTVRLPAAPGAAPAPESPAARPLAPGDEPRRILVVDDNLDSAQSLGRLLRRLGHTVRVAHDGPEALDAVAQSGPEIVLLDIGLPGMDGYEVARRLRAAHGTDTPLLVALTGYGQAADRERARLAGFDAHLVKPVDLALLQEIFRSRR